MLRRIFFCLIVLFYGMPLYLYGQVQLLNGGFEAGTELLKWDLCYFGARPIVSSDREYRIQGTQAIKLFSNELSDAAIAQEVDVTPGRVYSLTGWIRTQDLNPFDSPVFGTMIVQNPGGRGNIAYGQNHSGTTDWTKELILFAGPESGKVRLSLFFTGYGKGTGAAWFDDIRLEAQNQLSGTVKVQPEHLSKSPISPFQYGQFVEPFCDCGIGMWSEKLSDQSFEGITPFKSSVAFREATDFRYKPWYPTGAVNRGVYLLDETNPANGGKSQRIDIKNGEPCVLGIAQDGIAVNKGETYNFSVYLRGSRIQKAIRVVLHEQGRILAEVQFSPGVNWKKYVAEFIPNEDSINATLEIQYTGPGTLWLDQISLMPAESVFGWRKDVVEALKAMKPGIIRWGGIAIEYVDWKNLVGNPDERKPWVDPYWGGTHPPSAGLEEFVKLCQTIGAEPMICVRTTDSDASSAAAQVEYFNGAKVTPMGSLRVRNGHPEPYHVTYWQVGNEQESPQYTQKLKIFCEAMKKADPTIKLLSSFPNPDVLRAAAPLLDYVCPHHYSDLPGADGQFSRVQSWIQQYGGDRPIKIAVTEWNTTGGDWGLLRGRLWTLDNALTCAIYHNIMHRRADWVEISNRSDLINSHCAGCIQTDHYRLFKTPAYYVQSLYANKSGTYSLKCVNSGDIMPNEISATINENKDTITLFFVNPFRLSRNIGFDLSQMGKASENVKIWTVMDTQRAGQRDVINSFEEPERVKIFESSVVIKQDRFSYSVPELSLSVFCIKVEQQ